MNEIKTYEIDGQTYELVRPVFGVLRQVGMFCRDAGDGIGDTEDLCKAMGDRNSEFVALMLTPSGVHPRQRDLKAIAEAVEWGAEGGLPVRVVDDFFDQPEATPENLLAAMGVSRMLTLMVGAQRTARAVGTMPSTLSSKTSPNSQEETPLSGTKSSGNSDTAT